MLKDLLVTLPLHTSTIPYVDSRPKMCTDLCPNISFSSPNIVNRRITDQNINLMIIDGNHVTKSGPRKDR